MKDPTTLCTPGPAEKYSINIINVVVASLSLIGSLLTILSYSIKKYRKYKQLKEQQKQQQQQFGSGGYNHFQNNLVQTPNGNGSSFSQYSTNSGSSTPKHPQPTSKLPDLIFNLAISDFLTALCIIISQAYLMGDTKNYSAQTMHDHLIFSPCILFRGLIQFFFLSTFFWTTCISYYLYHQLSSPDKEQYLMYIFHIVSWGIPLVIVLGLGLSNSFIEDPSAGWCESGREFEFIFWFLPLFLCVIFCAVYYFRLRRLFRMKFEYRLQVNERLKQLDSTISRRLTLYIVVFLVCWTPDIIQHFISFFSTCNFYPLMLVQNLLTPAQGFLNLMVYSITNKVVSINAPSISKEARRLISNT